MYFLIWTPTGDPHGSTSVIIEQRESLALDQDALAVFMRECVSEEDVVDFVAEVTSLDAEVYWM